MSDKGIRIVASVGLAVGAILGIAGTNAPTASLRGLAWGIDGLGLIMAFALLTLRYYRRGHDVVAAGFLVFAIGETQLVASAPMDLTASIPSFGAGIGLWSLGLVLTGIPPVFPLVVRVIGFVAALLFAIVAVQIFAGVQITSLDLPLPYFAYPLIVATFVGWIWTLLKRSE